MRIIACCVFLMSPLPLFAQTTVVLPPVTPPAIHRDSNAITAVAALASANGWQRTLQPSDVLIQGTITRHFSDGDPSAGFTIRIRGGNQYSYEEGGFKALTNGATGIVTTPSGKTVRMAGQSALGMLGMIFPGFTSISDWQSPEVELTSLGSKTARNLDCLIFKIEHHYSDSDPINKPKQVVAPIELWVSKTDGTVVRADYYRVADSNHYSTLKETVYFSDYRRVNGVAVPFRQEIYVDDNHIKTLQFNAVSFNTGLTDADFNVKGVQGGAR